VKGAQLWYMMEWQEGVVARFSHEIMIKKMFRCCLLSKLSLRHMRPTLWHSTKRSKLTSCFTSRETISMAENEHVKSVWRGRINTWLSAYGKPFQLKLYPALLVGITFLLVRIRLESSTIQLLLVRITIAELSNWILTRNNSN